jgi:hypothetical protein
VCTYYLIWNAYKPISTLYGVAAVGMRASGFRNFHCGSSLVTLYTSPPPLSLCILKQNTIRNFQKYGKFEISKPAISKVQEKSSTSTATFE